MEQLDDTRKNKKVIIGVSVMVIGVIAFTSIGIITVSMNQNQEQGTTLPDPDPDPDPDYWIDTVHYYEHTSSSDDDLFYFFSFSTLIDYHVANWTISGTISGIYILSYSQFIDYYYNGGHTCMYIITGQNSFVTDISMVGYQTSDPLVILFIGDCWVDITFTNYYWIG